MRRVRAALVVVAALALLVAAGVVAWRLLERSPYQHPLATYPAEGGLATRVEALPQGAARWAYGSPDRHRLLVQWRDPDGSGWTAPRTVAYDEANTAGETLVSSVGGTVALVQTWLTEAPGEPGRAGRFPVAMVCRDRECTAGRRLPVHAATPQIAADGRTVFFVETPTAAVVWTVDAGFTEWTWTGYPAGRPRRTTTTPAQLGPDGSLRLVTSPNATDRCVFTLLVSDPGTAALEPVATVKRRVQRPREESCGGYLVGGGADRVRLVSNAGGGPIVVFGRTGDGWAGRRS